MGRITYRLHLKRRLKERKIPEDYPKTIYKKSKIHYFDIETKHNVSISRLKYAGKIRNMVAVYDKINNKVEIITVFPISTSEMRNKIKVGRWKKNEKN